MDNNEPEEKLAEEKTPEGIRDSLMEQIKDLRMEQNIKEKDLIPEIQKQKQNFYTKNQKLLFLVLLISSLLNMACFVVLLFL